MSGLMGTLGMGQRALQTQMKGLELTGHNLANVNNPNFSRQRIEVASTYQVEAGQDSQGTGVGMVSVQQVRDQILDAQIRSEKSVTGFLESRLTGLEYIQAGMGSVLNPFGQGAAENGGASGLNALFSDLIGTMHDVSGDPTSRTSRHMFLDAADALTSQLRNMDGQISDLEVRWDEELSSRVDETNQVISQIAALNQSIQKAERGGSHSANDLRDQRVKALETLSTMLPTNVSTDANGRLLLQVNGISVVEGETLISNLTVQSGAQGAPSLNWQPGGDAFVPAEGRLGGILEVRGSVLSEMRSDINALAEDLMQTLNQIHDQGFALDDSNGRSLFQGNNASDIRVNKELLDHPEWLQASNSVGEPGNNETIAAMISAIESPREALGERTYIEAHADMVARVGRTLQSTRTALEDQQAMESLMERQRDSISGVSLDEEMTQLVKYQRAFEASARLVTIVDDMLSTVLTMGR